MKIMVISDTHGNLYTPVALLTETGADLLVHLGDEIADAKAIEQLVDIPVVMVQGNCDHGASEQREINMQIAGRSFLLTHGDLYRVKSGLERLISHASAKKADIILFGHTHKPCVLRQAGMLLVNPGTLMPVSNEKSYAMLTLTADSVSAEIIHLPQQA